MKIDGHEFNFSPKKGVIS